MSEPPRAHQQEQDAPSRVTDLAEGCVRYVKDALGMELDYTPETLPILDHYLKERGRDAEAGIGELLVPATGAYFGEVVRRALGGARWHAPGDAYLDYRLEFEPVFLHFNPLGVAAEVLAGRDAPDWRPHIQVLDEARETIARSLETIDDVRPGDYYSFSVRYEVIEQVASLLRALESQQPQPRVFGREIYRVASGEPSDPNDAS